MNENSIKIKSIIKYLYDVYNKENIGLKDQKFYLKKIELKNLLQEYFISFQNNKKLVEDITYNYELIKKLSFKNNSGNHFLVREILADVNKTINVKYSLKEHQEYAFQTHRHLIEEFKKKLKLSNDSKSKRKITIKDRKVYDLFKSLNIRLDIIEDGFEKDFIDSIIGLNKNDFQLMIDNRNFHYILGKIKPYFYNFSIKCFAENNNIYSLKGVRLKVKNLQNSKIEHPSKKEIIDETVKNFMK